MKSIISTGNPFNSKILDQFDFGVLLITLDFKIIYANRSACSFLACETGDVVGKYFNEEFTETTKIIRQIRQCNDTRPNEKYSAVLHKRGAKTLPVTFWLINPSGQMNESGERMFCFQPIKDEKRSHKTPGNLSIEKIMASLIHEIRNPLGGIVGFSNLLEQDLTHLKYAHNMVLKIKQAAESIEKLINSLTIISRESSLSVLKPVLSQDYFGQLFLSFQNEIKQKNLEIKYVKNFPQNDVIVSINPFSFDILWDILLQQFGKILQDNNSLIFEIAQKNDNVRFEINLIPEESNPVLLKNGFRIPEIKRLMVDKILQEHHGKIYSFNGHKNNMLIRIELPRTANDCCLPEKNEI